jgi:hypothetical protein
VGRVHPDLGFVREGRFDRVPQLVGRGLVGLVLLDRILLVGRGFLVGVRRADLDPHHHRPD